MYSTEEDGETRLVSGLRFISAYWSHLPHTLVKGLGMSYRRRWLTVMFAKYHKSHIEPASVFGEIMGKSYEYTGLSAAYNRAQVSSKAQRKQWTHQMGV